MFYLESPFQFYMKIVLTRKTSLECQCDTLTQLKPPMTIYFKSMISNIHYLLSSYLSFEIFEFDKFVFIA